MVWYPPQNQPSQGCLSLNSIQVPDFTILSRLSLSPGRFDRSIHCLQGVPFLSRSGALTGLGLAFQRRNGRRLNQTKIDILDAKGQEAMRKVCRLAREVLEITAAGVRPGITTDYLDEVCHKACVERDVGVNPYCDDIYTLD